ncbi:MAG: hypothetical protein K0V04_34025 [Deltaproteobacteria bacterium]|nr:hypothetical protein [Deltaproteobacteria bacterium]
MNSNDDLVEGMTGMSPDRLDLSGRSNLVVNSHARAQGGVDDARRLRRYALDLLWSRCHGASRFVFVVESICGR